MTRPTTSSCTPRKAWNPNTDWRIDWGSPVTLPPLPARAERVDPAANALCRKAAGRLASGDAAPFPDQPPCAARRRRHGSRRIIRLDGSLHRLARARRGRAARDAVGVAELSRACVGQGPDQALE